MSEGTIAFLISLKWALCKKVWETLVYMQQSKKVIIIIKLNRITKNNIPTARIALCDRAGAEPGGRLHRNHPFPGQHQRVDGGCGVR